MRASQLSLLRSWRIKTANCLFLLLLSADAAAQSIMEKFHRKENENPRLNPMEELLSMARETLSGGLGTMIIAVAGFAAIWNFSIGKTRKGIICGIAALSVHVIISSVELFIFYMVVIAVLQATMTKKESDKKRDS